MSIDETKFPARDRLNDRMVRELRYTGPAAYPAGGDPINPSNDLGMAEIYGVYGMLTNGSAIRIPVWDYANQKLLLFVPSSGAEASGDVSAYSGTLMFHGKG